MEIGKLPNDVLEKIVFKNIENSREEVLIHAGVGKDCAVIDYGEYGCVLSTDPITGAINNIGSLAIHISCNDVASSGADPIGVMFTMLMPRETTEEDIDTIMKDAGRTAKELDIEIIGGHTEITEAVNKVVIITTVVGKQPKEDIIYDRDIATGDRILMTKYAGIEGTSIIASDLEDRLLQSVSEEFIEDGKDMSKMLSVLKEGKIGGEYKAKYMHDITEGGVLGALWETAKANDIGVEIVEESIPIRKSTLKICQAMNIDPLKLISSGSMIIIMDSEKIQDFTERLDQEGILVTEIGKVVEAGITMISDGIKREIESPKSDEIYKVI